MSSKLQRIGVAFLAGCLIICLSLNNPWVNKRRCTASSSTGVCPSSNQFCIEHLGSPDGCAGLMKKSACREEVVSAYDKGLEQGHTHCTKSREDPVNKAIDDASTTVSASGVAPPKVAYEPLQTVLASDQLKVQEEGISTDDAVEKVMNQMKSLFVCDGDECPKYTWDHSRYEPEQPSKNRVVSEKMWNEKRNDVSMTLRLGCASVTKHALFDENDSMTCRPKHKGLTLLLPFIVYTVEGVEVVRNPKLRAAGLDDHFKRKILPSSDPKFSLEFPDLYASDLAAVAARVIMLQTGQSKLTARQQGAAQGFARAVQSRAFGSGIDPCFDVPPHVLAFAREAHQRNDADVAKELAGQSWTGVWLKDAEDAKWLLSCAADKQQDSTESTFDPWGMQKLADKWLDLRKQRWDKSESIYFSYAYDSDRDLARVDEFEESLQWNICHPAVTEVHVVLENDRGLVRAEMLKRRLHDPCNKLRILRLGKRLHYKDAVKHANDELSFRPVMITNADIILGEGFYNFDLMGLKQRVHAMSRHERPEMFEGRSACCSGSYDGCHDAFMFLPPINPEVYDHVDHQQNVWGGENKFMYEMKNVAGASLSNPCLRYKMYHNHASDVRKNQNDEQVNKEHSEICCPSSNPFQDCQWPCPNPLT